MAKVRAVYALINKHVVQIIICSDLSTFELKVDDREAWNCVSKFFEIVQFKFYSKAILSSYLCLNTI